MGVRPADAAGRAVIETWRPVVGFEGLYEVSDQGTVRSLDRNVVCEGPRKGRYVSRKPGRLLRPGPQSSGHLSVVLGRGNTRTVHSLVMEAFSGDCPAGMEVRHRDGDEQNNWLSNLEYATRSRNTQDKKWHKGAANYVLAPPQVAEIKRRLNGPRGVGAALAREFGVAETTISAIKHGVFHRDVHT